MKRMLKRVFSVLLVAVLFIGIAPVGGIDLALKTSAKDISSYSVGDIITYGSYPQSKVMDSDLIAKIEAEGEKYVWCDYNYYAGTGDFEDGNMKPVEGMMLYKDIPYGGSKYRAVKINQYRPYYTGDTSSYTNTNQDDNGYYTGNVYYFKYEPLTWRVLDPGEGYVMCNKIIDSQAYQNFVYYNGSKYYNSKGCTNYASDWVTSSLRQWLNNGFYNTAFSEEEKEQIGTSYLENKSTYSSTYDSADTYDKIFPISYYDAVNSAYGFNSSHSAYDTARQMEGTDYAKCQGLGVSSSYGGTSLWRMRSPSSSLYAAGVGSDGLAYSGYGVDGTGGGVVPAFNFNPQSTICTNHTYTPVVTKPTCTEQGYTTYTCTCGDSYVADYVDALGHEYGEWVVKTAPTTLSEGLKIRYCKNCDAFETEIIDSLTPITVGLGNVNTNYKKSGQLVPEIINPDNVAYTAEYKSSKPESVIVDNDGNYVALKAGSAEITCTVTDEYGNISTATCKVNVTYAWWQWIIRIVLFGWIWY